MEISQDHIHILVNSVPKLSPKAIIRMIKQVTTFEVWRHYESDLKKYLWGERTFWSEGYFVCSIGNASEKRLETTLNHRDDLANSSAHVNNKRFPSPN